MKAEVKIIKDYLKTIFPNNYVSVSYKMGKGVLSADGLLIRTNIPFEDVQNKMYLITKYIPIIPKGDIYMESYEHITPHIDGILYTDIDYIMVQNI